jgi:hypothetical protein
MLEMMFGAGSPMWTAVPSPGLPYQALGLGPRSIAAPVFSSPVIAGGISGGSTGRQELLGSGQPSTAFYGYGGGPTPNGQQLLAGPGLTLAYPFAPSPFAPQMADPSGVVTAASMLAAVAMRRGQPQGPTTDAEVEEFVYDALDLLPGATDVEIRCESGRVTMTGNVQHKRTKRDVGEIAWAIPGVLDVQNNVSITSRRRARAAGRETDVPASVSSKKQG